MQHFQGEILQWNISILESLCGGKAKENCTRFSSLLVVYGELLLHVFYSVAYLREREMRMFAAL